MKTAKQMLSKFGYVIYVMLFMLSTMANIYGFVLNPSPLFAVWCIVWTVCMVIMGCTIEEENGL